MSNEDLLKHRQMKTRIQKTELNNGKVVYTCWYRRGVDKSEILPMILACFFIVSIPFIIKHIKQWHQIDYIPKEKRDKGRISVSFYRIYEFETLQLAKVAIDDFLEEYYNEKHEKIGNEVKTTEYIKHP